MIIVKFWGGFGNQLFIYAFYKELKSLGKEVKADIRNYNGVDIREFLLEDIGIELDYATDSDYKKTLITIKQKISGIINRIKKVEWRYNNSFEEKSKAFDKSVFDIENGCLLGYWQNPSYFSDVMEELRKEVRLKPFLIKNDISQQIEKNNSVSLHVRRTDYLLSDNSGLGNVCTDKYYENAIKEIRSKVNSPVFYVFSDDIEDAKEMISCMDDGSFVYINPTDTVGDMALMSSCKHHILANSSFSWWAAWLGSDKDSVVVIPEIWNLKKTEWDISIPGWIKVKRS